MDGVETELTKGECQVGLRRASWNYNNKLKGSY
jgi:hypothetical protein